jgi:predicted esterase YcpF (UPF0227 family)
MLRVLYLHGLGSSGHSKTVSDLRRELEITYDGEVELIAPTYTPESAQAWRNYIDVADKCDVVVGTSLGGYHALKLAEHCINAYYVVVNPCYDPREMLRKYVGQELPNYSDPDALGDRFTDSDRRRFEPLEFGQVHKPIAWIIGENDDVIDPDAQKAFAIEHVGCELIHTSWGHRVEDANYLANKIINSADYPF